MFDEAGPDAPSGRATILLVEDDAAIAHMMADVLESTGYQVREAPTGAAARALVEQVRPQLIILDLVLPDEDGLVLCSVLKNIANVPILICSGTQRRRDAFLRDNFKRPLRLQIAEREAGNLRIILQFEQLPARRVEIEQPRAPVRHRDNVRRRLEDRGQRAQRLLGARALGDVGQRADVADDAPVDHDGLRSKRHQHVAAVAATQPARPPARTSRCRRTPRST